MIKLSKAIKNVEDATFSQRTPIRVPFFATAGLLTDDAALTYDPVTGIFSAPHFSGDGSALTGLMIMAASIAALKAVSVTAMVTGQQANLAGYYAAADGGGGLFVYNSASAAADDGGMVIRPTSGSGRWLRVVANVMNVRFYGAKGDGATDDTTAIQAAINWLQNNYITSDYHAIGTLFFPRGRYKVTALTMTNAFGLVLQGEGRYASNLEFNASTGSLLTVAAWIGFYGRDLAFINKSATAYTAQTSKLFDMNPTSAGTVCHFSNCLFENFADLFYISGTLNGDTFLFDQCYFLKAKNAFRTANTQACIHKFTNCVFNQISVGCVNVTGTGHVHLDSCNIVIDGAVFKLPPAAASYGYGSIYVATNCQMEWTAGNPQWIECWANDATVEYVIGTFLFMGCCLDGGTGADPTLPAMSLSGRCHVTWIGGNYEGTVKYAKNGTLASPTNLDDAFGSRTEIKFVNARLAPIPANLILTSYIAGLGGPVFVYQGCANMPDMEFGGDSGYSFRAPHTLRYQPYFNQVGVSYIANPYHSTVDFKGRTVRINKVVLVVTGTSPVGNKIAAIYSDAGFTAVIGTVTFAGTGAVNALLVLTTDPTVIVDKLYLSLTSPSDASITGYWLIDYTVQN